MLPKIGSKKNVFSVELRKTEKMFMPYMFQKVYCTDVFMPYLFVFKHKLTICCFVFYCFERV